MMQRRNFLSLLAWGALGLTCPGPLMAKSAFELGLQGQELITQGRLSDAVLVLTQACSLDPANQWTLGLLARAYFKLGKLREARSGFRRILQINPDDTYSRMMVDMINQSSLPAEPKPVSKNLSLLEQEAKQEENKILASLNKNNNLKYQIHKIVFDPGHGGFDAGAVGKNKLREKDVNLDLAKKTAGILEKQNKDLKVFLTRTEDYYLPLSARTTTANQYKADLFVSFHINANANRSAHGMETYFCAEKASSKEAAKVASFENSVRKYDKQDLVRKGYVNIEEILFRFERLRYWQAAGQGAKMVLNSLKKDIIMRNRGVHSANFYVLRRARMPAILLETGFISNPKEEALLGKEEFKIKLAQSLARGILSIAQNGV